MDHLHAGIGHSFQADAHAAVKEALERAEPSLAGHRPRLAFVTTTVEHAASAIWQALREALPDTLIHGITTSLGVLSGDGVSSGPDGVLAILLLAGSDEVRFAVGYAEIAGDGQASGRAAAEQILAQSAGQPPALLLFNAAPGQEEGLLAGVAAILPGVPAFGGSAADHAIAGDWSVYTDAGPRPNAVSIAAIFGPVAIGGALIAPYYPVGPVARVTRGAGRQLAELDGQSAAQFLNRWLEGRLEYQLAEGGNILVQTALRPLAVKHVTPFGTHYLTLHPAHITSPELEVELFARVTIGEELCLMQGSVEGLIDVLGDLVQRAAENGQLEKDQIRAGVLIYCAGCAGSVGPRLHEGLRRHLKKSLGELPLLGLCTFGEQGFVPGLGNVHQDLSVSLVLIGDASVQKIA